MRKLGTNYWEDRWSSGQTGWDIGYASPPILNYFNQEKDKNKHILIPGCGNAYEAEFLIKSGFKNVWVVDISASAIESFLARFPTFPKPQAIVDDFFNVKKSFDIIVEQTFFCALEPRYRKEYAKKCHELLNPEGALIGLLFNIDFDHDGPPFGGNKEEYISYFNEFFDSVEMEIASNSIPQRSGKELFIRLVKND